jgi:hypothetical protein
MQLAGNFLFASFREFRAHSPEFGFNWEILWSRAADLKFLRICCGHCRNFKSVSGTRNFGLRAPLFIPKLAQVPAARVTRASEWGARNHLDEWLLIRE